MVLFAVWIEFNIFRVSHLSNPISGEDIKEWWDHQTSEHFTAKYKKLVSFTKYFTALIAVAGTFIWGYGDIVYQFVQKT